MMTHQKVRDVSVQLFAQKCVTVKFTIFLQVLSFLRYGPRIGAGKTVLFGLRVTFSFNFEWIFMVFDQQSCISK